MLNRYEYDEMRELYNRNQVLKDLCDLHYFNGLHTGKWEDELGREESCEEYVENMKNLAKNYDIEYSTNLEDYIEDEDDEEYVLLDRLGFEIKEILEKYLLDLLIA